MHFASRTRSKTTGVAELELKSVKVRNDEKKAVHVAGSHCAKMTIGLEDDNLKYDSEVDHVCFLCVSCSTHESYRVFIQRHVARLY